METNLKKKKGLMPALVLVIMLALAGNVSAQKLYVLSDTVTNPMHLQTFGVAPDGSLIPGGIGTVPKDDGYPNAPTDIAIDEVSGYLFMTRVTSSNIRIVNSQTMAVEFTETAPSPVSAIAVDSDSGNVYAIARSTNTLYAFNWDRLTKTFSYGTPRVLAEVYGYWSEKAIALDEVNDLLYVGDRTTQVKVYNTSDWTLVRIIPVSQPVTSIAVDEVNGILYTGNYNQLYGSSGLLCKVDLKTNAETLFNIRSLPAAGSEANVVDIDVDPLGRVYLTTGLVNYFTVLPGRVYSLDPNLNYIDSWDLPSPGALVGDDDIPYTPPVNAPEFASLALLGLLMLSPAFAYLLARRR